MRDAKEVVKNPIFILKMVEMVFAIVCIALLQNVGLLANVHKIALVYMVYCGYILIPLMEISKLFTGEKTDKSVGLLWSFVGAVLWVTAGALVIESYRTLDSLSNLPNLNYVINVKGYLDQLIASGILALLNALVYFTETAVTFKFG